MTIMIIITSSKRVAASSLFVFRWSAHAMEMRLGHCLEGLQGLGLRVTCGCFRLGA